MLSYNFYTLLFSKQTHCVIVILEFNHVFSKQRDSLNVSGEEDELPKSIIVTNVDLSVFDNLDIKVRKSK